MSRVKIELTPKSEAVKVKTLLETALTPIDVLLIWFHI
jgi:hypothetical protein